MVLLEDGRFAVVYGTDGLTGQDADGGIRIAIARADGTAVDDAPVNTLTNDLQGEPTASLLPDGRLFVARQDQSEPGPMGGKATLPAPNAQVRSQILEITSDMQAQPVAVADTFDVPDSGSTFLDVLTNDQAGVGATTLTAITRTAGAGTFTLAQQNGVAGLLFQPGSTAGATTGIYEIKDANGSTSQATVTVQVTAVNDPPTAVLIDGASSDTLAENSAPGTVIGTLTLVDPDAGTTGSFTIVPPQGGATVPFQIVGNQLRTAPGSSFDFEAGPTRYTLTVKGDDGGGLSVTSTLTITITDVNETSPPPPPPPPTPTGNRAPTAVVLNNTVTQLPVQPPLSAPVRVATVSAATMARAPTRSACGASTPAASSCSATPCSWWPAPLWLRPRARMGSCR